MVKKILIVDDKLEDLQTMQNILEAEEYIIHTAENGANALDILASTNFDLILIDIKMPTLSGYDLLKVLKERISKNVKIIYVSIVPKKEVNLEGVDGFIQKPFSKTTLLKAVRGGTK
ncbi:response regulator [archaeon]|jgi:CheY-like chemotaxis protein|nr:response regulator [archaeon]